MYVQRLAVRKSQLLTITYNGQLSQFQKEEDSIRGGHAETASPTLSPHVRDFARNIELLRKSKEDCRIDAALREKANAQDFFDQEVDDVDIANLDSDDDDSSPEELTPESLIAAYHSIANSWHKELTISPECLPNLSSAISPAPVLQLQSFIPLDVFQHPSHGSSGLPPTTLQQWDLQIHRQT